MKFKLLIFHCALLATCAVHAATTAAQQNNNQGASQSHGYITVVRVTGEVYVFQAGDTLRFALRTGSLVTPGQQIATGPKANVMLAFSNGATVTIGENAIVSVDEFTQKPFSEMFKMAEATKEPSASTTRLNLVRGEVLANVKKLNTAEGSTFEVKTPIGIAGIRGTTFDISYFPPPRKKEKTATPIAAENTPAFALVMLEGAIAMQVPGRSRPIIVPEGKQLVLDASSIDPDTGALAADAANDLAPTTTPVATQAQLLQSAQTMLNAANSITMPSTAALSGMSNETPADKPAPASDANANGADAKQPKSGDEQTEPQADSSLFPAPPAQNPAPRLSPTDGVGN